jgi:cytochrome d ubiquinol oxidase subunit I
MRDNRTDYILITPRRNLQLGKSMGHQILLSRIHFAFTIMFHYIFPQLTMGLALLIVILKTNAVLRDDPRYHQSARFWARIFAVNFVMGVVTGIPMEFQFGTNWATFSQFTGGVIGHPVSMEGVFSFFMESAFLGLFLFGEKRLSKWGHWATGVAVFVGSWLSGYFITMANAWMQHPVAYTRLPDGTFTPTSFWGVLLNPWGLLQYMHTMTGAVITASFVMAGLGAFYLLGHQHEAYSRIFVRIGVIAGLTASIFQVFPSGDEHGRYLAHHQPVTAAAMEGLFHSEKGAAMVMIGQPNPENKTMQNPIAFKGLLSFLVYGTFSAEVKGLDAFPQEDWPDNIALVFFSYHIMVGLGTIFVAVMMVCAFLLWRRKLFDYRWPMWALLLCVPFPYIANMAGWVTAETGRQPWIVYGLMRTREGYSHMVSTGDTWFTLLGFMGLYGFLSILFLFLLQRMIVEGPQAQAKIHDGSVSSGSLSSGSVSYPEHRP